MKKTEKVTSTFEKEMRNAEFKAAFDEAYEQFALQEVIEQMAGGVNKSVRALAKETGLHPNAVQKIKSGKNNDIKLTSFLKLANAHGYSVQLVRGKKHIPVLPNATGKSLKKRNTAVR
jgi:hypothetical protein